MISLYVTALGFEIGHKPANQVYSCLRDKGYLRADADPQVVTSLIDDSLRAFSEHPDFEAESWRHVQAVLLDAGVLSSDGQVATAQFVTRNGEKVR